METLPDSLILNIFNYLQPKDIANVSGCSRKFRRIAHDEILWRDIFHSYFNISPYFPRPIGRSTWREEFHRLVDETPFVETEVVKKHTDEVLHVSFSNDGKRFATCGKDAFVYVWKDGHPVELEFQRHMMQFNWKYTQYSEFNETDTLLLVSGVLFGIQSTSGEIAVFNLEENFMLQCRIQSKPYDIFGTWYSEKYLFSGDLKWLGNLISLSTIWLNRASQEVESEHIAVINKKYCFYNPRASSIRSVLVANCVDKLQEGSEKISKSIPRKNSVAEVTSSSVVSETYIIGNDGWELASNVSTVSYSPGQTTTQSNVTSGIGQPVSHSSQTEDVHRRGIRRGHGLNPKITECSEQKRRQLEDATLNLDLSDTSDADMDTSFHEDPQQLPGSRLRSDSSVVPPTHPKSSGHNTKSNSTDEVIDSRHKWLIFTCGSETYTSHQVGFKRIPPFSFKHRMDPGLSIKERRQLRRQQLEAAEEEPIIEYWDYPKVAHLFDEIDHVVNLHGHIIGMALSPDHHYLYVNCRPWPQGYKIVDPLDPPPIAQEIDIHVIDLTTLKQVGTMRRAHKAYTPNDECFFIFLDASDFYLASGAEDKHAYVWDRHYGISLSKLPHDDVCNSVAFNPKDSRMLVSVSDDKSIKVWRSKNQCRELGIDVSSANVGTKLYHKRMNGPQNYFKKY